MSTITDSQKIADIARAAAASIGDDVLLPQGHCVDVFLDLYNATQDTVLRWSISEHLAEISHVSMVLADDMRSDLAAIVALTAEDSLDLAWAEAQFNEPSIEEVDLHLSSVIRWASTFRPPA
ncbi:MAG TPA: hypothetical protein VLD86_18190 [Ilumatobacteraceae bacterium]|nr:hypothetical protein [Ilumatobacteraceae bacterium]